MSHKGTIRSCDHVTSTISCAMDPFIPSYTTLNEFQIWIEFFVLLPCAVQNRNHIKSLPQVLESGFFLRYHARCSPRPPKPLGTVSMLPVRS